MKSHHFEPSDLMNEKRPHDASGPRAFPPPTADLLRLAQAGDEDALQALLQRSYLALRRWAHGRLPKFARDLLDTDDLVQITLLNSLNKIATFDAQRPGAFLGYLRRALVNKIRDELRRLQSRSPPQTLPEEQAASGRSPLEQAMGREVWEEYERALLELTEAQREAVILRVELEAEYSDIAEAIGSPSANAARMTVVRGLTKLAEKMSDGRAE